jgi:EpsI family protein
LLATVERSATPGAPDWQEVLVRQRRVDVAGRSLAIRQTLLQADGNKLLVWRWYRQSGIDSANPLLVKLLLAKSKLAGGNDAGAEVVLACAYDEQAAQAEATLLGFLGDMLPAIQEGLDRVNHR